MVAKFKFSREYLQAPHKRPRIHHRQDRAEGSEFDDVATLHCLESILIWFEVESFVTATHPFKLVQDFKFVVPSDQNVSYCFLGAFAQTIFY